MSIPVTMAALAGRIAEFGAVAYLVTVGDRGRPHVVSVRVEWSDDALVVAAGNRTSANAAERPDVTLVWPAPPKTGYSLIVDGSASAGGLAPDAGGTLTIRPVTAVLHRTPEGDPDDPSCVTVLGRD